ncbi:hypothetical protein F4703DRAFT_1418354 [Phycomyces blakesleeanus]
MYMYTIPLYFQPLIYIYIFFSRSKNMSLSNTTASLLHKYMSFFIFLFCKKSFSYSLILKTRKHFKSLLSLCKGSQTWQNSRWVIRKQSRRLFFC